MPRKATGPRNKARGYEHEREIVKAAEAEGLEAKRAWGSNGKALGLPVDVDVVVGEAALQCKRRKALPKYLQIPESCIGVVFREDRGTNMVLIELDTFMWLLKQTETRQKT